MPPVCHSAIFSRVCTSRTPISPWLSARSVSVVYRCWPSRLAITCPLKARSGSIHSHCSCPLGAMCSNQSPGRRLANSKLPSASCVMPWARVGMLCACTMCSGCSGALGAASTPTNRSEPCAHAAAKRTCWLLALFWPHVCRGSMASTAMLCSHCLRVVGMGVLVAIGVRKANADVQGHGHIGFYQMLQLAERFAGRCDSL